MIVLDCQFSFFPIQIFWFLWNDFAPGIARLNILGHDQGFQGGEVGLFEGFEGFEGSEGFKGFEGFKGPIKGREIRWLEGFEGVGK